MASPSPHSAMANERSNANKANHVSMTAQLTSHGKYNRQTRGDLNSRHWGPNFC